MIPISALIPALFPLSSPLSSLSDEEQDVLTTAPQSFRSGNGSRAGSGGAGKRRSLFVGASGAGGAGGGIVGGAGTSRQGWVNTGQGCHFHAHARTHASRT